MNTKQYIKAKKKCPPTKPQHPKENLQELHNLIGSVLHEESIANLGSLDVSVHLRERIPPPCEIISHLP